MKQPKKLTYDQKRMLADCNHDWHEYMLASEDKDSYVFIHKETKELMTIQKPKPSYIYLEEDA